MKTMKRLEVSQALDAPVYPELTNRQVIIPHRTAFCKNFLDLLKKIFVYDATQRITAKQALQHPWFKAKAHEDDGTEAAKIRLQRNLAAEEAAAAAAPRHHGYRR